MKRLIILFVLVLFLGNIFAFCEENQIDINSASLEELDSLYGIGPVKAQAIIDTRPFDSVDDLIDVYGIGPATLQKIKDQGLVCVNGKIEEINEEVGEGSEEDEIKEDVEQKDDEENEIEIEEIIEKENIEETKIELIKLESKDIKSENNKEDSGKNNYAIYGFVFFCILLGFLFMFRKNRFNKNEFR